MSPRANPSHTLAPSARQVRELAGRADDLAATLAGVTRVFRDCADEPVSMAGFCRFEIAAGQVRQAAAGLRAVAADLDRITAARQPGLCGVPWGVCPAHGNTLTSSGGVTWCRASGCARRWDHDRARLPCAEPARWRVTDTTGASGPMCDGHAHDARRRLVGADIAPLDAKDGAR